jgi:hypothetical protein
VGHLADGLGKLLLSNPAMNGIARLPSIAVFSGCPVRIRQMFPPKVTSRTCCSASILSWPPH